MEVFKCALAALGLLFVWVQWIEPHWLRFRKSTVHLKKPLAKPLHILHLSDLHTTKHHFHLDSFFNRLSALNLDLDLVFVTGDLIDAESGIGPCLANLKKLKPRLGTYVVFGNHEYRDYPSLGVWRHILMNQDTFTLRSESERARLKDELSRAGMKILLNQNLCLPLTGGEELELVGLDDPVSGHADISRAFSGVRNGAVRIALSHSPMTFPALAEHGVDLAFAGHTHGGQIRLPGLGPLAVLHSRVSPIIDSTAEYGFHGIVSRGMGAKPGVRMRFFCRPEVLLVQVEGSR